MSAIIGILSDSHGRVRPTAVAVQTLLDNGATTLIHLGDIGSDDVINELVGHNAHIVLGNCDFYERPLIDYAESVGVTVDHPAGRLEIDSKTIAFTHGHLEIEYEQALTENVDYLLHGHTHELRDERIGDTRVINPGALSRASEYTVAALEPATDRLQIFRVPK